MRKSIVLAGLAAGLTACGQSPDNQVTNAAAANNASTEAPKPSYCFFKDSETKDWKAKLGKDGNVVVTGKAYRQDSRYKVVLTPPTVTGTTAEVSPTIVQNDSGFAAPGDWWDVSETVPNSGTVASLTVKCGDKAVATLTVPRKK